MLFLLSRYSAHHPLILVKRSLCANLKMRCGNLGVTELRQLRKSRDENARPNTVDHKRSVSLTPSL